MFSIDYLLDSGNGYYRTWDNPPGAEVVDTYTVDGVVYVDVVFEGSPEKVYTYIKDKNG